MKKLILFFAFYLAFATSAFASADMISTVVAPAFAALQAMALQLAAIAVPIIVAVLGLFIMIKFIKRFANKL